MTQPLRLHQEIMLLAIRDDNGKFSQGMFLYSVAGSILSELLLCQRIETNDDKQKTVAVIDQTSTGDPILDEVVGMILESKPKGLQHWVSKVADLSGLKHRVAQQLCDKGILRHDEKKVLWLFTQQVYPELDGSYEDALRNRMAKVMFDEAVKPDGPTAALIALAKHGDLLPPNFAPEELRQHKQRIENIAEGGVLASEATQAAIQAIQAAIMVATMMPMIIASTSSH